MAIDQNIGNASEAAQEAASTASDTAKRAIHKTQETLRSARDRADRQWSNVQKLGEEQVHRVQERVQHYPLSSLLIAAGIGVVIGMALRGSSD